MQLLQKAIGISDEQKMNTIYLKSKKRLTKSVGYNYSKKLYLKAMYFFELLLRKCLAWVHRKKIVLPGINLIGFAKGDFGLAEHLRLVTRAIKTTSIAFCVNNSGKGGASSNNTELDEYLIKENPYRINLFCYNAEHTLTYIQSRYGAVALNKHYNIGYGYWELSVYPSKWTEQNKYLDEIWAPSRFIKEVIEKTTTLPVHYMPIPVDFAEPIGYSRQHFNLPENSFLYLFTFDMSSFVTRKNPQAVIQAFMSAFPVERKDNVSLVVKINRIKNNPEHTQKVIDLTNHVAFDSRILIIDEILDRSSILGLISVCDAYVSLHRSEGFGLGMAEAMKMGKVVIATHYSGNKDFMNEENSCPVRYKLIKVQKEEFAFVEEGAEWADPDIEHAVYFMRKVYEDQAFSKQLGTAAKAYISKHHSFAAIGENYTKRVQEIQAKA